MPSIRGILGAVMIESLGVLAVMGMLGVLRLEAGPAKSAPPPAASTPAASTPEVARPVANIKATPEERARFTEQQLSQSGRALEGQVRQQLEGLADRLLHAMATDDDR